MAERKLSSVKGVVLGEGLAPLLRGGARSSVLSPYLETALCSREDRPSRQRTGTDLPCVVVEITHRDAKTHLAHFVFLCCVLTGGSFDLLEEDSAWKRGLMAG